MKINKNFIISQKDKKFFMGFPVIFINLIMNKWYELKNFFFTS